MNWGEMLSSAIDIGFATFGEDVVLEDAGVTVRGIYAAPYTDQEVGGMQVSGPDPTIDVRTADVAALGPLEGQRVTVRGASLVVVEERPMDDGATVLTLREYA